MIKLDTIRGDTPEPLHDDDDYRGGEGWVIVAVGEGGRACLLDQDPGLGAIRWLIECGVDYSPEEMGIGCPEDPGVYKARVKAWTTSVHDYDGADNDMGFDVVGEWIDLFPEGVERALDVHFAGLSNEELEHWRDRAQSELDDRAETASDVE